MKKKDPATSRARVLVIEDNPEERDRIIHLLTEGGQPLHRISTAPSLYSGFTKLHQKRYDAVLLDLSLPDSVGFRTLDFMIREAPNVPIIAMTGLGDLRLAERAVKRGAHGYICKKHDMQKGTVRRLVREAIERKQHDDEKELMYRFLEIANSHHKLYPLLQEVSREIQRFTECEAVRIRLLDEAGKLETLIARGFGNELMTCEQCVKLKGDHCICLKIAHGQAKELDACITEGGSFYAEVEGRVSYNGKRSMSAEHTVQACANRLYQSVAIVPLRRKKKILGLLQVADPRPYIISPETVKFLERLGSRLGDAIRRVQAEQALNERETEIFNIFHSAPIMMGAVDSQLRVQSANRQLVEFSPLREPDIVGQPVCCGLGCAVATGSEYANSTPADCSVCQLPGFVRQTIEDGMSLFQSPLKLFTEDERGSTGPQELLVSSTPLTVSHRRLALFYLEHDAPHQKM